MVLMKKEEISEPYELSLLKKNINLKKLINLLDNDSKEFLHFSAHTIFFNIIKSSTKKKKLDIYTDYHYALLYPDLSIEKNDEKKYSLMINGSLLPTVSDNFILKENFKKFYPNKKNKEISLIFQNIYSKLNKSYYLAVFETVREFTTYSDGPYPEYYNDYYILGKFKNTKSLFAKIKKVKEQTKKKYSNFIFRS